MERGEGGREARRVEAEVVVGGVAVVRVVGVIEVGGWCGRDGGSEKDSRRRMRLERVDVSAARAVGRPEGVLDRRGRRVEGGHVWRRTEEEEVRGRIVEDMSRGRVEGEVLSGMKGESSGEFGEVRIVAHVDSCRHCSE